MNKHELVASVAESTGLGRSDSARAVEAVLETVTAALKSGQDVKLVGFGTFLVTRRKESSLRNPRTGEPMQLDASNQPKFKAGKVLKDAVNEPAQAERSTQS